MNYVHDLIVGLLPVDDIAVVYTSVSRNHTEKQQMNFKIALYAKNIHQFVL